MQAAKEGKTVTFISYALTVALNNLLGGLAIMILAPIAHRVVGIPEVHPGYVYCVAFVALLRALVLPSKP